MRKVLARPVVIPTGVFITDEPELQPRTKLEKACDDYIRALPEDYFVANPNTQGNIYYALADMIAEPMPSSDRKEIETYKSYIEDGFWKAEIRLKNGPMLFIKILESLSFEAWTNELKDVLITYEISMNDIAQFVYRQKFYESVRWNKTNASA